MFAAVSLRSLLAIVFWSGLTLVYALFVFSGFWPGVVAVPIALIGLVIALRNFNLTSVIFIAGTPTVFVYANNFLAAVPFLRVERAMLPVFAMILLYAVVIRKRTLKRVNEIEKWMLAMLIVCGVSVVLTSIGEPNAIVKENAVLYIQGLLLPYAAYFIARQQTWTEREVYRWLVTMMLVGAYLVVTGALQLYLDMSFFYPKYLELPEPDRASATFVNPSHFGLVLTALLYLAVFLYLRCRDAALRSLVILCAVTFCAGLLISKTRAPWLGAFVGGLWLYYAERRLRFLFSCAAIGAILTFIVALPWLIDSGLMRERVFYLESMYPRLSAYTTALNIIWHNPIAGLGFGRFTFIDAKPEFAATFGLISMQWTRFAGVPHNEFLHVLVLSGILGFVPLIMIIANLLRATRPLPQAASRLVAVRSDFATSCRAIIIAYVVNCLLVDVLLFQYFLMLMFFSIGVLVSIDDRIVAMRPPAAAPF